MSEAEWIAFLARPEFPAFNRAMLVNPEDDLPRLVFADWMDENCPDAAVNAGLRASITGESVLTTRPDLGAGHRWTLTFARGRLVAKVDDNSTLPVRKPSRTLLQAAWRAGWVEHLSFGLVRWRTIYDWAHSPPFALTSALSLSLVYAPPHELYQLFARSLSLTSLVVDGWVNADTLLKELTASQVARIRHLTFVNCGLRHARGLQLLARHPSFSSLRSLVLRNCFLGPAEVEVIAHSPNLRDLICLELDGNDIIPAAAAALADSPYLCEAIRAQWRR